MYLEFKTEKQYEVWAKKQFLDYCSEVKKINKDLVVKDSKAPYGYVVYDEPGKLKTPTVRWATCIKHPAKKSVITLQAGQRVVATAVTTEKLSREQAALKGYIPKLTELEEFR